LRSGLFQRVCFISYAGFQGVDPLGVALSTLATMLGENLADAEAARAALAKTPTLVILDNLESLTPHPKSLSQRERDLPPSPSGRGVGGEGLLTLLDAAQTWSEAGHSRVLLTSRQPDFAHSGYPIAHSRAHWRLKLDGLAEEDAWQYCHQLMALSHAPGEVFIPPARIPLLKLFQKVACHPLSIGLLARQLSQSRIAEVSERLEELLAAEPEDEENRGLLASLNLSLERLNAEVRQWLPRLGVFQNGAMESVISGQWSKDNAPLFIPAEAWLPLKNSLIHTGLIEPENLPGLQDLEGLGSATYLRFHPTLAPALSAKLDAAQREALQENHWRAYYRLSGRLYHEDDRHPHQTRAIAWRELPNLLRAVYAALDANEPDAADFANKVSLFLHLFGLRRDHAALVERSAQNAGAAGSRQWFLAQSNLGEQLYQAGRYTEAQAVFSALLAGLGAAASDERCQTLGYLGRCFSGQGRPDQAEGHYREALAVAGQLVQDTGVKRQTGVLQTDLADALRHQGDYAGARAAYAAALAIDQELGDERGMAVDNGQLGTLALQQNDLPEATRRYREALAIFQRLGEPATEAVAWHQLGRAYQQARQWEAAEQAYRESARLKEGRGDLAGAARSWNQLAQVTASASKPAEADTWYRKAIAAGKAAGDRASVSKMLSNLADLLQQHSPSRLPEARQLAEEGLEISKTLDPAAAEIWKIYITLANIAAQQGEAAQAAAYRQQARAALLAFKGTRYALRRRGQLMMAVIAAKQGDAQAAEIVQQHLEAMRQGGADWTRLADALQHLLAGSFQAEMLDQLALEQGVILETILQGIANPERVQELLG